MEGLKELLFLSMDGKNRSCVLVLVPLQLVVPEVTGVVLSRGVWDVLIQRVGEGQAGQEALGRIDDWSIKHLQDNRGHAEKTHTLTVKLWSL